MTCSGSLWLSGSHTNHNEAVVWQALTFTSSNPKTLTGRHDSWTSVSYCSCRLDYYKSGHILISANLIISLYYDVELVPYNRSVSISIHIGLIKTISTRWSRPWPWVDLEDEGEKGGGGWLLHFSLHSRRFWRSRSSHAYWLSMMSNSQICV